jgi:putative acetyltransferase
LHNRNAAVGITIEDPRLADVRALIAAADALSRSLYPPESNHLVDVAVLAGPETTFFVARTAAGAAVGTGALWRHDAVLGEVKRMWVDPAARGQRLGLRLLEMIEGRARELGLARLALETGIHNREALALYRKASFTECMPFAGYKPDPLSVFMSKELA